MVTLAKSLELATAMLDPIDALSVGQSLRVLARHQKTPHGTREIYERVGNQLVSAARIALTKKGG